MARRTFLACVLLAAVAVGACGAANPGGQPGASTGSGETPRPASSGGVASADPCSLLSADEVWAIMNSDPLVAAANSPISCVYSVKDVGGGAAKITWETSGGEATLKSVRTNPSFEVVDGIGDEALRDGEHLIFPLGDQVFEVPPQWGSEQEREAQAIVMAKVIIARVTGQAVPEGLIPTPPPVLSTKDPCKLLSGEEAGTVLGTGPLTAVNNDTGATNQPLFCYYNLADGSPAVATYLDPKGGFDEFDTLVGAFETQPIEGLGDKAVFEAFEGKLYVLKGDTIFTVNAYTVPPDAALDVDRQLMEIILSHL